MGDPKQMPIRVFYDEVTERIYAASAYRDENGYVVVTGEKHDVTNDIADAINLEDLAYELRDALFKRYALNADPGALQDILTDAMGGQCDD